MAKYLLYLIFFSLMFFLLGFFINDVYFSPIRYIQEKPIPNSQDEIIQDCKNYNLTETAYCLRDNIATIYNYTITDDSKSLTFDELKTIGGDCKNWAEFYNYLSKQLGFKSRTYSFNIDGDMAHRIEIISDNSGYCVIDQLIIFCVNLDTSNQIAGEIK